MIEGEKVRLRAFEPADAPLSYERINDPEVCYWLARRYPLSMANQNEWVQAGANISYANPVFAIVDKVDGRLLGGCDLRTETPEIRTAGLGIAISDKTAWEQGYGTDAMRVLCRFGFEEMNLHRIDLWVHDGNDRARHLYEKLGFTFEGTARESWFQRGQYFDMHMYALFAGQLR